MPDGTILLSEASLLPPKSSDGSDSDPSIASGASYHWIPIGLRYSTLARFVEGAWDKVDVEVRASGPVSVYWMESNTDKPSLLSFHRATCSSWPVLSSLLVAPSYRCVTKLPRLGYTSPWGRVYLAVVPETPGIRGSADAFARSISKLFSSIGKLLPFGKTSSSFSAGTANTTRSTDVNNNNNTSNTTIDDDVDDGPIPAFPDGRLRVVVRYSAGRDYAAMMRLILGLLLFLVAPWVARSRKVHLTSGALFGALAFVLIVCFVILRLVPGKRVLVTVSSLGVLTSVVALMGRAVLEFLTEHVLVVALCVLAGAVSGFFVAYKWRLDDDSQTLLRWSLQLFASGLLLTSSNNVLVSMLVLALVAARSRLSEALGDLEDRVIGGNPRAVGSRSHQRTKPAFDAAPPSSSSSPRYGDDVFVEDCPEGPAGSFAGYGGRPAAGEDGAEFVHPDDAFNSPHGPGYGDAQSTAGTAGAGASASADAAGSSDYDFDRYRGGFSPSPNSLPHRRSNHPSSSRSEGCCPCVRDCLFMCWNGLRYVVRSVFCCGRCCRSSGSRHSSSSSSRDRERSDRGRGGDRARDHSDVDTDSPRRDDRGRQRGRGGRDSTRGYDSRSRSRSPASSYSSEDDAYYSSDDDDGYYGHNRSRRSSQRRRRHGAASATPVTALPEFQPGQRPSRASWNATVSRFFAAANNLTGKENADSASSTSSSSASSSSSSSSSASSSSSSSSTSSSSVAGSAGQRGVGRYSRRGSLPTTFAPAADRREKDVGAGDDSHDEEPYDPAFLLTSSGKVRPLKAEDFTFVGGGEVISEAEYVTEGVTHTNKSLRELRSTIRTRGAEALTRLRPESIKAVVNDLEKHSYENAPHIPSATNTRGTRQSLGGGSAAHFSTGSTSMSLAAEATGSTPAARRTRSSATSHNGQSWEALGATSSSSTSTSTSDAAPTPAAPPATSRIASLRRAVSSSLAGPLADGGQETSFSARWNALAPASTKRSR